MKEPNVLNAVSLRRIILEQSRRANVGHIGSSLSIADIVVTLYRDILNIPEPRSADRDRLILSKGHAVLAVYAALFLKGWLTESQLNTFCGDGTTLGVHPERALPGIDFSSGSLGQGLSIAAGAALAARLQTSTRRSYAVLSDAECNEGSTWEAVMFAAHHRLTNLTAVIDLNGQQALGYTGDVIAMSPMAERWRAFGWDVHQVDGHDVDEMTAVIRTLDYCDGPPHVLIARTTFGKGVSFMENQIKWHYWPMSDDEYEQALTEVETFR
jgi:transketolase